MEASKGFRRLKILAPATQKQRSSLTPTKHRVANEVEANANAA